jgi:hypothetical protein
MRKNPVDVKILAQPGAALDETTKRIWAFAGRQQCPVAIEQIQDAKQIAFFGAPAVPAVIVAGELVHTGCVPDSSQIKHWFAH